MVDCGCGAMTDSIRWNDESDNVATAATDGVRHPLIVSEIKVADSIDAKDDEVIDCIVSNYNCVSNENCGRSDDDNAHTSFTCGSTLRLQKVESEPR